MCLVAVVVWLSKIMCGMCMWVMCTWQTIRQPMRLSCRFHMLSLSAPVTSLPSLPLMLLIALVVLQAFERAEHRGAGTLHETAADEVAHGVFMQSYIPQSLMAVKDAEEEMDKIAKGDVSGMFHSALTGVVLEPSHPAGAPERSVAATTVPHAASAVLGAASSETAALVGHADAANAGVGRTDDSAGESESESGSSSDEDGDEGADRREDREKGTGDEVFTKKGASKEERKAHKAAIKEGKREKRKTKVPKKDKRKHIAKH